jgi:DNA topoisomerase-2
MSDYDPDAIRKKYPKITERDHARSKEMWAGSHNHIESEEYIVGNDDVIILKKNSYPPALYKAIDEAIVNALDHIIRCHMGKEKVTYIKVNFCSKTGKITVENNGPGIEIVKHPDLGIYIPQYIFGSFFSGSNLKKTDSSIIGGTNGVGIKLTNAFSTVFTVETVYKNQYYKQTWTDGMNKVSEPEIIELTKNKSKESFTKVSFILDFHKLFGYKNTIEQIYNELSPIVKMRMYKAAAYAGWTSSNVTKCYYNDELIPIMNMSDIANKMFPVGANVHRAILCPCEKPTAKHIKENTCNQWEVCIAYVENTAKSIKTMHHLSNINGVSASGGKHLEFLFEQIRSGVEEKITKELKNSNIKFQPSYIYSNIFLFINAKLAGAQWTSQRKDELSVEKKYLDKYILSASFINEVSTNLREKILETLYCDESKTKKKRLNVDKYAPAKKAGTNESHKCSLILPEGDSAKTMCKNGLSYRPKGLKEPLLGYDYYGILTLGGVILNARKESEIIKVGSKTKLVMSQKMAENKFVKSFIAVMGLNTQCEYDPKSPTYISEMKKLRYGRVISFVDQDHDGVGFIHSLIINLFERCWPKLLEAGFVYRFATPIRRAIPIKKALKIIEFYSDTEYNYWRKRADVNENDYTYEHIKGLATNKEEDVAFMFKNFQKRLYKYIPDEKTPKICEDYFGKNSEPRKRELRIPYENPPDELILQQNTENIILCSDHILYEAKSHKLSNLKQKLYHAYDGMNESGRKILDGSIKKFRTDMREVRVSQLAGYISEHEAYHHGEASLMSSIAGKACLVTGGVQLPQLLPCSTGLGSRDGGPGDVAQPRYTKVKLNKRLVSLMYPDDDAPLLKYVVDDGELVEPEYFLPILPSAVMESVEMPADGWKIKVWARDVYDVLRNVRRIINSNQDIENLELLPMKPYTRGYKGEIKSIRGDPFSFGNYVYNPKLNMIHITELPLRVWSDTYTEYIKTHKSLVSDIFNYSSDEQINIEVYLSDSIRDDSVDKKKVGAQKKTKKNEKVEHVEKKQVADPIGEIMKYTDDIWADGVEVYLELRRKMDQELNMIGKMGEVLEFNDYGSIIKYWYVERKNCYIRRVERTRILLELNILRLKNIIRYVNETKELSIVKIGIETAINILEKGNYNKINTTLLDRPGFTPVEELKYKILNEKASFDYLLETRDIDKLDHAIKARNAKLEKLIQKLNELNEQAQEGKFPGAKIWLNELDQLEKIIKMGFETNWKFGDTRVYE